MMLPGVGVFARRDYDVSLLEYDASCFMMYGVQHAICNVHHDVYVSFCATCNVINANIIDSSPTPHVSAHFETLALIIRSFLSTRLLQFLNQFIPFAARSYSYTGNGPSLPTASSFDYTAALYVSFLRVSAG